MIALSTGSLYTYGLDRVFELAREVGFDGVEVLIDERWDTRQADYLGRLRDRHGIPIVSLHSPFSDHVDGWEGDEVSRIRRSVALAEALGARTVVVHLPRRFSRLRLRLPGVRLSLTLGLSLGRERVYRRWLLEELAAYQAETPVTIAVENMPLKRLLFLRVNPYQLNEFEGLEAFPHLVFDTTHLGTRGFDIIEAYERLKARIAHVHLSNYNGREHRLLDDGHLPLGQLLRRLRADGYRGIVTLEFSPRSLGGEDEGRVRANLERSLVFCRQHF